RQSPQGGRMNWEAARDALLSALGEALGKADPLDGLDATVREAALSAATALGKAAVGLPVSAADMLHYKSTLQSVKYIGTQNAVNLWEELGAAAGQLIKPFAAMLGSLFGVKIG